jgi:hypothetical protein
MLAVKNAHRKVARDSGARYAKLLATHEQHAAELSRAMNRWQKSRKALWAAEKRLDREFAARSDAAISAADPFNDTL